MGSSSPVAVQKIPTALSEEFVLFWIFLVLKLTQQIDWSWLWVAAPLWMSVGVGWAIAVKRMLTETEDDEAFQIVFSALCHVGVVSLLLCLVFGILQLAGTINWAWWWVVSPLWLGVGWLPVAFVLDPLLRMIGIWSQNEAR